MTLESLERRRERTRGYLTRNRRDPLYRKLEYTRTNICRKRNMITRFLDKIAAHERHLIRLIRQRDRLAEQWRNRDRRIAA